MLRVLAAFMTGGGWERTQSGAGDSRKAPRSSRQPWTAGRGMSSHREGATGDGPTVPTHLPMRLPLLDLKMLSGALPPTLTGVPSVSLADDRRIPAFERFMARSKQEV